MAQVLDGKAIAAEIKQRLMEEIESLKQRHNRVPKLVAVQAGENAASQVYINNQRKSANALGIDYELKVLPESSDQKEAEEAIMDMNRDEAVTAVIIQLPVPKHLDAKRLVDLIDPIKDAEGMHPANLGKVLLGKFNVAPCTPLAVMELLKSTGENLYGKEAVVVGHSEIVGKPLSLMLLNEFATITVCHIATGERGVLPEHVKKAEILVVAVGKANLIKGEWIKKGAIVIDVGINRVEGKIVGDVEFEEASRRASYITPVPGGVGPLTTTMLMRNTIEALKAQID